MGTIFTSKGDKILLDNDLLKSFTTSVWGVNHGYAKSRREGKLIMMHRLVMGLPDAEVDHINGDKLDNRRVNLRLATHAQNQANRKMRVDATSGFKGVNYDKSMQRRKRWSASIHHEGRRIKIGRYFTAQEAAHAYDKVATRLKGEFARLNFRRIES